MVDMNRPKIFLLQTAITLYRYYCVERLSTLQSVLCFRKYRSGIVSSKLFPNVLSIWWKQAWGFAETEFYRKPVVPSYSLNKQGTWHGRRLILKKYADWQLNTMQNSCYGSAVKTMMPVNITLQSLGLYRDLFALWQDTGLKTRQAIQDQRTKPGNNGSANHTKTK